MALVEVEAVEVVATNLQLNSVVGFQDKGAINLLNSQ
jgi:hypothetical protein